MSKYIGLSIYLLKENINELEDALKEKYKGKIEAYENNGFKIVKEDIPQHNTTWADYLNIDLKSSSCSAVLFIKNVRWFALSFGYGHNFLDTNQLQSDFGLITALNMLDAEKIKSSDIFAPSDHSKQRRVQTVRDSNLFAHDIDKFSNILKNITGKSKEEYNALSKTISASSESIKVTTKEPVNKLGGLCKNIYDIYKKKDYKNHFSEVLAIHPIKDEKQKSELNKELLKKLNNRNNGLDLEVPELIDFKNIEKFKINIQDRKKHICNDFNIQEFYKLLGAAQKVDEEKLKKWEIVLLDSNDNKKNTYPLIKCFVFDCKLEKDNFHFSHGKWYEINSEFSQKLDSIDKYKKGKIDQKALLEYSHDNEEEYNKALAQYLKGHFLDKKLIPMGGYDKIEVCDVLCISNETEKTNTFIHVKRKKGGSSGLSHLFYQGDNSLTMINNKDEDFLDEILKIIKDFDSSFKTIVHYLIINESQNDNLPLFSKISLFKTIESIKSKGAEVRWSIVTKK